MLSPYCLPDPHEHPSSPSETKQTCFPASFPGRLGPRGNPHTEGKGLLSAGGKCSCEISPPPGSASGDPGWGPGVTIFKKRPR